MEWTPPSVSRKRVLRVMRENNLLSPHRCRRRGGNPHVGEIITHAPNLMWGTDAPGMVIDADGREIPWPEVSHFDLSDHFTNQIKFWGIQPSYAFVEQPQTNGVAERFNRTLKEQIIHGRIYRNIAELRNAVRGFVEQYNAQWIVEKNGYLSPAQARQAWHTAMSLRPAA